jgi:hypothetical protein
LPHTFKDKGIFADFMMAGGLLPSFPEEALSDEELPSIEAVVTVSPASVP